MTQVMPAKLRNSPLLEALFEIRFTPVVVGAGDVLPGLIFGSLRAKYSRVEQLPAAAVPRAIRAKQEALVYQPSHRLHGSDGVSIQVGDRVAAISTTAYPGWGQFRPMIEELITVLRTTAIITTVERFSFRYINMLKLPQDREQLPLLNIQVQVIGKPPQERGFLLRTEIDDGGFSTTVQIAPNATAQNSSKVEVAGLLVDIDTVATSPLPTFLSVPVPELDKAHQTVKKTFFSLLTEKALTNLGPE